MPVTPLINGTNYSWANVTLVLFGVPVVGITKINYKNKQEKKNNFGSGVHAVSRGYGNVEPDGDIEIYLDEWKAIIAKSPNKDPLQIAPFDIPISFGGSRVSAQTDVLRSVEFLEDPMEANQGDTKLMVKIPLVIGLVEHK